MRNKTIKKTFGKNFIILPLVFVIVSALSFYVVMAPIFGPIVALADMAFKGNNYSSQQDNIYDKTVLVPSSGVVKLSEMNFPNYGQIFGNISIDNTNIIYTDLCFGDGIEELRRGVCVYNGSSIPGGNGTTLIAGHSSTYFNGLKDAQIGSNVTITTNYGQYIYKITGTKIANKDDTSAYPLSNSEEGLIMYTCYPFDELGLTPYRYFVYADYVSGPKIDFDN